MAAIHGDKQQNERDWVLNEFKTGKSPIMVATDVASRGIGMIENMHAPFPSSSFSLYLLPLKSCDTDACSHTAAQLPQLFAQAFL